jgi:uncharacterized membrane protein YgaE (UPF0421/DUF939 family)
MPFGKYVSVVVFLNEKFFQAILIAVFSLQNNRKGKLIFGMMRRGMLSIQTVGEM